VKWFRWNASHAQLAPEHEAALRIYDSLPAFGVAADANESRLVVVDVETTGLRPYQDRLLAIGAVTVQNGLIRLANSFETTIRQEHPSEPENILVHGIDGTAQTSGLDAADALIAFLEFVREAPLVGFHAEFDRVFLTRAMRDALRAKLRNAWLDLADLAPALFPEHAQEAVTLDEWIAIFGIENAARHEALSDAVATAQLLQVVLARASQLGTSRFADLVTRAKERRWLVNSLKP
jgi:DNA polymerase III subunit epsilon